MIRVFFTRNRPSHVAGLFVGSLGFLLVIACQASPRVERIPPSVGPAGKVFIATFTFQEGAERVVRAEKAIMTFGTAKVPKTMGRDFVFQLADEAGTILEEYGIPDPLARRRCPEMEGSGIPEDVLARRCDPKKKDEIIKKGEALYKGSYSVKFPYHRAARTIRVLDATGKLVSDTQGQEVVIELSKVIDDFCQTSPKEPECLVK